MVIAMDVEKKVHYINRVGIYKNYKNEKFLAQLMGGQSTLPIAKKYDADLNIFWTTIVEGLLPRMGIELEEAKIRAKSISIFFMGLIEFHFNQKHGRRRKRNSRKLCWKCSGLRFWVKHKMGKLIIGSSKGKRLWADHHCIIIEEKRIVTNSITTL